VESAMLVLLAALFITTYADGPEEVLYAWVGNSAGDYLATINNDIYSSTYGAVMNKAFLPNSTNVSPSGNQPHHIAVSRDGNYVAVGGLLSFTLGKDEVFVFSLQNGNMAFYSSVNLPGACTDEFHPTNFGKTQFVVSQMCADDGTSPGHLVSWNIITNSYSIWETAPLTNFNPHGGDFNLWGHGFIIADFVLPLSLFSTNFVFRDTVRYFDNNGNLLTTFNMPGPANGGYMATKWVGEYQAIASASASHQNMYLIDVQAGTITSAIDFGATSMGPLFSAGLPVVDILARKGFMSYGLRYLVLFSWTSNFQFSIVKTFDFCQTGFAPCSTLVNGAPATHYLALSLNRKRLIVSNSFVAVGNAQFPGSGAIYSFDLAYGWTDFTFNTVFHPALTAGSYPHGMWSVPT